MVKALLKKKICECVKAVRANMRTSPDVPNYLETYVQNYFHRLFLHRLESEPEEKRSKHYYNISVTISESFILEQLKKNPQLSRFNYNKDERREIKNVVENNLTEIVIVGCNIAVGSKRVTLFETDIANPLDCITNILHGPLSGDEKSMMNSDNETDEESVNEEDEDSTDSGKEKGRDKKLSTSKKSKSKHYNSEDEEKPKKKHREDKNKKMSKNCNINPKSRNNELRKKSKKNKKHKEKKSSSSSENNTHNKEEKDATTKKGVENKENKENKEKPIINEEDESKNENNVAAENNVPNVQPQLQDVIVNNDNNNVNNNNDNVDANDSLKNQTTENTDKKDTNDTLQQSSA